MSEHTTTMARPQQTQATEYHRAVDSGVNVGDFERVLSVIGGGALALYGLRRSLGNLMLMLGGGALIYRGLTGYCAAYQAVGITTANQAPGHSSTLEATITVNKPAPEVYRFWRHLENYPRFMKHLELVVSIGEKRSHWVARGPLHMPLIWDAELLEERDNTLLSWRSLSGADVDHMGTVRFRELPNGRGTEVRLRLAYALPGGMTGVALAKFFQTLTVGQLKEDLRHFKQIIEAGETPTIANQPAAAAPSMSRTRREREVRV
jgi:uncharacterized membrane protein